jgi:CRISPR-associated protein Cmr2
LFDRDTLTVSPALNEAWKSIDAEIRFHSTGESFPGRSFEHSPFQECLFEGRLADEIVDESALKQMTISHQQFVRQFNLQLDKPYYAILQADGDRMGAIIQACLGASQNEQAHIALSFALSRFSNTVKDIVAQHAGVTVYSGGDDVLALLPVQTAIACATAVQHAFVAAIQPMLDTYNLELQPSVSVGLVIAHHMDPMSDVLQQVRRTEQTAKIKRSSLALTVSKRSGGNVTITGEWSSGIVARLNTLVESFRNGQLPHGYAYELRAMVSKLYAENTDDATTASILKLESERILKRKNTADGKAAPIQQMMMMYQSIAANSERERSKEWINELIVAREIA